MARIEVYYQVKAINRFVIYFSSKYIFFNGNLEEKNKEIWLIKLRAKRWCKRYLMRRKL